MKTQGVMSEKPEASLAAGSGELEIFKDRSAGEEGGSGDECRVGREGHTGSTHSPGQGVSWRRRLEQHRWPGPHLIASLLKSQCGKPWTHFLLKFLMSRKINLIIMQFLHSKTKQTGNITYILRKHGYYSLLKIMILYWICLP